MKSCLKSFRFKDTYKEHIMHMKDKHVNGAMKLLEILNESNNDRLKVTTVIESLIIKS